MGGYVCERITCNEFWNSIVFYFLKGGDVSNTSGLNSPTEVYFFTRNPDEYTLANRNYGYEISRASENDLERAAANTLNRAISEFQVIQFGTPAVDVQGKEYIYVVRSRATYEEFKRIMSPEYVRTATRTGLRGLHYSSTERSGDAIGIRVEADSPQAAKQQFEDWYAKIKTGIQALADRFVVVRKEIEQEIAKLVELRREELDRAKKAL